MGENDASFSGEKARRVVHFPESPLPTAPPQLMVTLPGARRDCCVPEIHVSTFSYMVHVAVFEKHLFPLSFLKLRYKFQATKSTTHKCSADEFHTYSHTGAHTSGARWSTSPEPRRSMVPSPSFPTAQYSCVKATTRQWSDQRPAWVMAGVGATHFDI